MSPERLHKRIAAAALLGALGIAVFVWLGIAPGPGGMLSNDQLFNIASGIDLRHSVEPLGRFHAAAVRACAGEAACEKNQVVLLSEMPFNYPIAAATGLAFAARGIPDGFSSFALKTSLYSLAIGFACALALLLLFARALTATERMAFALALLAGTIVLLWRPARALPVDLLTAAGGLGLALMPAVAAMPAAVSKRLASLPALLPARAEWVLLALAVATAVLARHASVPLLALAAVALAAALLAVALVRAGLPPAAGIVLVTASLAILSTAHFLAPSLHVVPRSNLFLAALPLLAAIMLRPRSRWVYALPVLAVFHVSAAAVVALMLFCAELWLTLWGRGSRRVLLVAGITGLCAWFYGRAVFTGLTQAAPTYSVAAQLLTLRTLLELAIAAVAAGYAVWLSRLDRPASARAVLLVTGVFLLHQIDLRLAHADPFDPGMYVIKRAYVYCAPALLSASLLAVLLETVCGDRRPSEHLGEERWRMLVCWVALIVTAWSVGAPESFAERVEAAKRGARAFAEPLSQSPPALASMRYDSSYPIPCGRGTGTDSLKFLSYAKLRFRLHEGVESAERMRLLPGPGC